MLEIFVLWSEFAELFDFTSPVGTGRIAPSDPGEGLQPNDRPNPSPQPSPKGEGARVVAEVTEACSLCISPPAQVRWQCTLRLHEIGVASRRAADVF